MGWLGLVGVMLAAAGALVTATTSFMWAFLAPYLAAKEATPRPPSDLLGPKGPVPSVYKLLLAYIFLLLPGFVMTGIFVITAGVLPAAARWLILIGIVVSQPGNMISRLAILGNAGGLSLGVGFVWLGLSLLAAA